MKKEIIAYYNESQFQDAIASFENDGYVVVEIMKTQEPEQIKDPEFPVPLCYYKITLSFSNVRANLSGKASNKSSKT